jgi:dTDP-4-amino-4,6-dideoxygalactose transaminase
MRTTRRDALQAFLHEREIGTQIHYPVPPHLSRAYSRLGWKRGDFPLAEQFADQVLSLPIGPHISAAQVDFVCDAIGDYFGN